VQLAVDKELGPATSDVISAVQEVSSIARKHNVTQSSLRKREPLASS
jgi:hypothetical protein